MKLFARHISAYVLSVLFISTKGIGQVDHKHLVTVNHPAFGKNDPNQFYLRELRQDSSKLDGYFLDTESVVCFDHNCKSVPVRIFWDVLGRYQKYELSDGNILEKKKGEPFLPEDYDRLHEILKDKSSPYKGFSYYEVVAEKIQSEGDVDAVTRPSPIIIDEMKTIEGAAWTCFTLWHWANGEIVHKIQKITGDETSTQDLLVHLGSGKENQKLFAINELIRRKDYDTLVVEAVIEQASKEDLDPKFIKNTLTYLEQSQTITYYKSLEKLLETNSTKRRIVFWSSILKYSPAPSQGYFDKFFEKLLETKDYQEINLFLTILEQKKSFTSAIIQKIVPLLKEDYSILNRRVYWFLSEQKLTHAQKQILQSYYNKYSNLL